MKNTFRINDKEWFIEIRFPCEANFESIIKATNQVEKNDLYNKRLWIFESDVNVTTDQVQTIANYSNQTLSKRSVTAFVVPTKLLYGLARMHQAYRDDIQNKNWVFYSETEAIEWLQNTDIT